MAKRVDANHWDVVLAFRARGWFVESTANLGHGFPDLLVAKGGVMKQIEVKDGAKVPSKRRLTPDETLYHACLVAAGCPVVIVESLADVDALDRSLLNQEEAVRR